MYFSWSGNPGGDSYSPPSHCGLNASPVITAPHGHALTAAGDSDRMERDEVMNGCHTRGRAQSYLQTVSQES